MTLGRIIEVVDGEKYALIGRRWLTKIFVCGDVVCFLLLGGGTILNLYPDFPLSFEDI